MKKLICTLLCLVMVLGTLSLFGCEKPEENNTDPLKFGLGVYVATPSATDATEDKDGQGKVEITAATITVDKDGKIVACVLDTAANTIKYTLDGKAVAERGFSTKKELGDNYGMKSEYGSTKEWYEHVAAFENLVKGKTLAEVKALVVDGDKGNSDVMAAGCTITINEFVLAIEKAYNNAKDSNATAANTLKLGVHTEQTCTDATEEKPGSNQVETTFFAAALDADGKAVATSTDCVQVKFTFDNTGASTFDATKEIKTKKELGDSYGMKAYGGSAKEWFEQAAAFEAAVIGKTKADIASLMAEDNYGSADIKAAGCTILVNGFVKAAEKALTVAG